MFYKVLWVGCFKPYFSNSLQNYRKFVKCANFLCICYFCFTKKGILTLFSSKIGRDFTPMFGIPFIDRGCPSIFM